MLDGADPLLSAIQYKVPPVKPFSDVCTLTRWAVKVICVLDKLITEREETEGRATTIETEGNTVGADVGTDKGTDVKENSDHYLIV